MAGAPMAARASTAPAAMYTGLRLEAAGRVASATGCACWEPDPQVATCVRSRIGAATGISVDRGDSTSVDCEGSTIVAARVTDGTGAVSTEPWALRSAWRKASAVGKRYCGSFAMAVRMISFK